MKIFIDLSICLDILDSKRVTSKKSIDWYFFNKNKDDCQFYFSSSFIPTFYNTLVKNNNLKDTIFAIDTFSSEILPLDADYTDYISIKDTSLDENLDSLMVLNSALRFGCDTFVTNNKQLLELGYFKTINIISTKIYENTQLGVVKNNLLSLANKQTSYTLQTDLSYDAIGFIPIASNSKYIFLIESRQIKLFNLEKGTVVQTFKVNGLGESILDNTIIITPDKKYMIFGDGNKIKLFDMKTKSIVYTFFGHRENIASMAVTSNGKYIVSGCNQGVIKLWDISKKTIVETFKGHDNPVSALAVTPNGRYIASASEDNTIMLWSIKTKKLVCAFEGHTNYISSLIFTSDGKFMISGSWDKTIRYWDLKTKKLKGTLKGHTDWINSVVITADDKYVVSASNDSTIKLWDINKKTRRLIQTFEGHAEGVNTVTITPDDKYIVSAGEDNTIKLWDTNKKTAIETFKGSCSEPVSIIAVTPDGKYILSASDWSHEKEIINLWNINTGTLVRKFKLSYIKFIEISYDGKYIICTDDTAIKIYDINTGVIIKEFEFNLPVKKIVTTKNGNYIVYSDWFEDGSADNDIIHIYDIKTETVIQTFKKYGEWDKLTISNGKYIASGGNGSIIMWDMEAGFEIQTFTYYPEDSLKSLVITQDGKNLISGYSCGAIVIWDIETGSEIQTFNHYVGPIVCLEVTADNQNIVYFTEFHIIVCDIKTGNKWQTIENDEMIFTIALTANGKYIISGDRSGAMKLWDIKSAKLVLTFVNYDDDEWISFTSNGYYNCSDKAYNNFNLLENTDGIPKILDKKSSVYRERKVDIK